MNSQRIFLIVLFIIGLLFIISINIGATHDDQKVQTPDWLAGPGGVLTSPQPLKLADLSPESTSCLQRGNFVVPAQRTCTFAIQQSVSALRVITLQLVQGTSVTVKLIQEATLPVQQSLTPADAMTKDDLKVYPGKAHGALSIACLDTGGASACLVTLK
ncbi:MAG: hypothetical protein J2P37_23270 [Ktedonobacteraceae bacterium]|nr:hypothetical protein [Ktedonobacteraceae bacterium]MBO0790121.1 hypothetical protein [Ktedonobacteraceae bacterium]